MSLDTFLYFPDLPDSSQSNNPHNPLARPFLIVLAAIGAIASCANFSFAAELPCSDLSWDQSPQMEESAQPQAEIGFRPQEDLDLASEEYQIPLQEPQEISQELPAFSSYDRFSADDREAG